MKKAVLALLAAALILTGCASKKTVLPEWVTSPPSSEDFFYGIASANTGEDGKDYELARERAFSNLASMISAQVVAESKLINRETSMDDGNGMAFASFSQLEEKITLSTNQNIKDVEEVARFNDPDGGTWVYLQYSRAKFYEEKKNMEKRVKDLTEPALTNPDISVPELLSTLHKGFDLLDKSPYFGSIATDFQGAEGALSDLLLLEFSRVIEGITVDAGPEGMKFNYGDLPELSVWAEVKGFSPAGLPLIISFDGGTVIEKVLTGKDGSYTGPIDFNTQGTGKHQIFVRPNWAEIGLSNPLLMERSLPEKSFYIDIEQIPIKMNIKELEDVPGLAGKVKGVFNKDLPFKISNDGEYTLNFEIIFEDFPPNDMGITFTNSRAVVSLERFGEILLTFETEVKKEGGLDAKQAHERAVTALFEDVLDGNEELYEGIAGILLAED